MAKARTQYVCQSCGHTNPRWLGRCPSCEAWNSLVEEKVGGPTQAPGMAEGSLSAVREEFRGFGAEGGAFDNVGMHGALVTGQSWVPLEAPEGEDGKEQPVRPRLTTGMGELDRVLGGGLVPDSFVLLGGDPGIGKSTLLLQMAAKLAGKVLYVTGEESIDQIRSRARRLGVRGEGRIFLAAETQLERVFATVKELRPSVVVMDSLQTFSSGFLQGAPGSVGQVREVAARLMALAKSAGVAVWLVGHVTKEGSIAGPKTVEHMVDAVLYFEGEGGQNHRILRTVKNRFGSTREIGVFEMEGEGLREVTNPSSLFLGERRASVAGTAVAACLEGSRPLLVELQALVASSSLAVPRRTSVGMDSARIALLGAILEKHARLKLAEADLFFNVAGGLKLAEPACDLAAAAAIWSSCEDEPLPGSWVWIGELGLTGEVRRVGGLEQRLQEAAKLGFTAAVVPPGVPEKVAAGAGLKLFAIERVSDIPRVVAAAKAAARPRAAQPALDQ